MKTIKKSDEGLVFQGDVAFERATSIPKEAKAVMGAVVAHSETGHHHCAERAKVYAMPDGMTLYMRAIGKSVDVVHQRPFDTHETLRFESKPGDIWKVRRQREHTPAGWRQVAD